MRLSGKAALLGVAGIIALLVFPAVAQQGAAPARKVWMAWSPKPTALSPYAGVNKPIWRLADVLAAHKGQASWSQQIIDTPRYNARWVQMAPGGKTPTLFWADDRAAWVVWSGQIRFTIAGQKPFVASRGFLVEVPFRVAYSMETVGNAPSLRFEITHGGRLPVYPADAGEAAPPNVPGTEYIKVSYPSAPATYDAINHPYIDFFKQFVAAPDGGPKERHFLDDTDNLSAIIRGMGVPTPPDSNRGHFHVGNEEFWFILEGKIDYLIEGVGLITADPGDIVLATPGRWHRASFHAGQMDTRLSFNTRPEMMHNYGEHANGTQ